ncbi:type IV secretory system conjugative DNA transfer family protein [Viridibacillus arvi]|uniref:type IV secretory system conjugative DNA transfer family protein n=1 Tax=Viridibacillus arvi TaxID=263475 RepID=UPI003D2972A0
MMDKETWIKRAPKLIVGTLTIVSLYMMFRTVFTVLSMLATQYMQTDIHIFEPIFGGSKDVSIFWLISIGIVSIFGWLLSTRVKAYQSKFMRVSMFSIPLMGITASLVGFGMSTVKREILPFFYDRLTRVIDTNEFIHHILFEQVSGFYLILLILPTIVVIFILMFVSAKYLQHEDALIEAFFEFEWKGNWLRKFSEMEGKEVYPDIELGLNTATNEMVVLPGFDRTLNTSIVGPIGTGKTAALGLPMLNQDLHYLTKYINDYPKISKLENYHSEDILGHYLNGISVIEPSNDLCQKMYKLCKAHNIPDEAITYIDPTNPNTPSINPLRGPVDKVAEVFAQVIAGLSDSGDGGNFFFEQAQRTHLKHFIYLLKMHDETKDVTFDMLLEMYENTNKVHEMHQKLKTRFPDNFEDIEDRDERNYWKILKGIDEWFNNNLVPMQERLGQGMVNSRDSNGNLIYEDLQEKNVQGLRNILNDIGANPLIRRVLFGTSDFDFDKHMSNGGILLVNTAKGELEALNSVLGKIVLMTLQNASFRRPPNISAFHHIFIDEAPEYLYNSFRSFPAQSRKYKVIITTLQQTIAQMADAFGEHYMTTIIAAMRNRMVYGDLPSYDAKYFSEMFGERFVYQEGESEQAVSPLQDNPVSRSGSTYSKVREQNLTSGDIMYQDAFQCAVKIVVKNKPIPVQQIKANFVPQEEFEVATCLVNDEAAASWLSTSNIKVEVNEELYIESIEETEERNKVYYDEIENKSKSLDLERVEKATSIHSVPRPPISTIQYGQAVEPTTSTINTDVIDIAPTITENRAPAKKEEVAPIVKVIIDEPKREQTLTKVNPLASESTSAQKSKGELLFSKKIEVADAQESITVENKTDEVVKQVIETVEPIKVDTKSKNPLLQHIKTEAGPVYSESKLNSENADFLSKIQKEIQ